MGKEINWIGIDEIIKRLDLVEDDRVNQAVYRHLQNIFGSPDSFLPTLPAKLRSKEEKEYTGGHTENEQTIAQRTKNALARLLGEVEDYKPSERKLITHNKCDVIKKDFKAKPGQEFTLNEKYFSQLFKRSFIAQKAGVSSKERSAATIAAQDEREEAAKMAEIELRQNKLQGKISALEAEIRTLQNEDEIPKHKRKNPAFLKSVELPAALLEKLLAPKVEPNPEPKISRTKSSEPKKVTKKKTVVDIHDAEFVDIMQMTRHLLSKNLNQLTTEILYRESAILRIYMNNIIQNAGEWSPVEGVKIDSLYKLDANGQIEQISTKFMPILESQFINRPAAKHEGWAAGTEACRIIGIDTDFAKAMSAVIKDFWLSAFKGRVGSEKINFNSDDVITRLVGQRGILIKASPDFIRACITPEMVYAKNREINPKQYEVRADEVLKLSEAKWIKGVKLCEKLGVNGSPDNIKAANLIIEEYYTANSEGEIVKKGSKAGEGGVQCYIDSDEVDSHPEIINARKIVERAQDILASRGETLSYVDMIKALKGRAPGTVANADDIYALKLFLDRRISADEDMPIKKLVDTKLETINSAALPYLRDNYLTIMPESKEHYVTSAKACEKIGTHNSNSRGMNFILNELWLEGKHGDRVIRAINRVRVGVYIDPELLKEVTTPQQVKDKQKEIEKTPSSGLA